jgi:hypothetical protein
MTDTPGPFSAPPPPPPPPPGPPQGPGQGPPPPGWWQASDGRWYPPQAAPGGYQQPHGVATKTNGLAIASLAFGIFWLYWVGSLLAIILGAIALKQIDSSGGRQTGKGMAIGGLVLGVLAIIGLILLVLAIAIFSDSSTSGY